MDRQMNAVAHDLAARNAVAWTFAKNDPTAVADAAMVSAAVTKSLATWPDVGPRRQPWMTLTPQERAVEMEAFRLVEEREPQTWRAMVLRHLLFQRRATPATINAIANFYGRENDYDSAQNAAAVCSHLAKLPQSPDSDSGLALLTRVVENMPQPVPDDLDSQGRPRDTGILPSGLLPTAPRVLCISVRDRGDAGLLLPGQTSADPDLPLLPFDGEATGAPLLRLVDAAGVGGMQPGRGARLDKRVLIYALLSMPIHARRPGGRYDHRRPLRWWVDKLFPRRPNGQTSYRPVKDSSRILAGLEGLIHAKIQLPDGTQWRPVLPRQDPDFRDLDSPLRLDIALPVACDHGAAIAWPHLITAGTKSDPAFDLVIGLAYLWDQVKAQNGGHRIYATRPKARRNAARHLLETNGNVITSRRGAPFRRRPGPGRQAGWTWPNGDVPVSDWRHPRAVLDGVERHPHADKIPTMTREARRRLVFTSEAPRSAQQASNERAAAERAIEHAERAGIVVVERLQGGVWRLLEPAPERSTLCI